MRTSVVNSRYIFSNGIRFEGKYHLNENSFLSMIIEKSNETQPLEKLALVFNPPVFKRQFCSNTPNAVAYYQSSDVQNAEEKSSVFVNKKQAETLNLLVKEGDILVTGFGTIGNTKLVTKNQDSTCYANNVCRIRVTDIAERGYIYAFLSSKYGSAQLNKNASGSVVRYIEAPGIKKTLIPLFDVEFRNTISDLIEESKKQREIGNNYLEKAHNLLSEAIPLPDFVENNTVKLKTIFNSHDKRFEASYCVSKSRQIYDHIINNFDYYLLSECTNNIFKPGIFKRSYVEYNGIELLGGADMMNSIPQTNKQIAKSQVERMPELKLEKDWILVTRAGTIGNTMYVDDHLTKKVISEDVLRIVPKDHSGYIYAFLTSNIGHSLLTLYTYGSVIPHIEVSHIENVPIPRIDTEIIKTIDELVKKHIESIEISKEKELDAIQRIEQEIEKWNN